MKNASTFSNTSRIHRTLPNSSRNVVHQVIPVFAVRDNGPVVDTGHIVGHNIGGCSFEVFFVGGEEQALWVIGMRCAYFVIFVVFFDVLFLDERVLSHDAEFFRE